MAEARERAEWKRTSYILCQTAEINRNTKRRKEPFRPAEFHPYEHDEEPSHGMPITAENIAVLKGFVPGGRK